MHTSAEPQLDRRPAMGTARTASVAPVVVAEPLEVTDFPGAASSEPTALNDPSLEPVEFDLESRLPPFPHLFWHPLRATAWIVSAMFGLASLVLLLAILAAVPIANFVTLGYLLEAEGRVARSGRLRNAFPLLGLAPRIGSIALGLWLWMIPLRLLGSAAADALLIDPRSPVTFVLHALKYVAWFAITLHVLLALARGGSLGCFIRPLKNVLWLYGQVRSGSYFATASREIRTFFAGLRLRHHFLLGVRGFAGAFAWLIVPTALYAAVRHSEGPEVLVTLFGGTLLVVAFAWLPFLQAHFAATNRFGAFRELRTVRRLFGHAPFAWLCAAIVVYVLALPLYLFKIALPPSDAMWFVTLVFVASIYPARVVTGWAYHRAVRRQREGKRSWWITRMFVRILMLALIVSYVFLLFFTQFIGEEGKRELFQHHAFLLPWPMLL
jgi:hypothetical protein